jgi:hypothetical protein
LSDHAIHVIDGDPFSGGEHMSRVEINIQFTGCSLMVRDFLGIVSSNGMQATLKWLMETNDNIAHQIGGAAFDFAQQYQARFFSLCLGNVGPGPTMVSKTHMPIC